MNQTKAKFTAVCSTCKPSIKRPIGNFRSTIFLVYFASGFVPLPCNTSSIPAVESLCHMRNILWNLTLLQFSRRSNKGETHGQNQNPARLPETKRYHVGAACRGSRMQRSPSIYPASGKPSVSWLCLVSKGRGCAVLPVPELCPPQKGTFG